MEFAQSVNRICILNYDNLVRKQCILGTQFLQKRCRQWSNGIGTACSMGSADMDDIEAPNSLSHLTWKHDPWIISSKHIKGGREESYFTELTFFVLHPVGSATTASVQKKNCNILQKEHILTRISKFCMKP